MSTKDKDGGEKFIKFKQFANERGFDVTEISDGGGAEIIHEIRIHIPATVMQLSERRMRGEVARLITKEIDRITDYMRRHSSYEE